MFCPVAVAPHVSAAQSVSVPSGEWAPYLRVCLLLRLHRLCRPLCSALFEEADRVFEVDLNTRARVNRSGQIRLAPPVFLRPIATFSLTILFFSFLFFLVSLLFLVFYFCFSFFTYILLLIVLFSFPLLCCF